jgi:hypothetical protein
MTLDFCSKPTITGSGLRRGFQSNALSKVAQEKQLAAKRLE